MFVEKCYNIFLKKVEIFSNAQAGGKIKKKDV
jgi:hypothetical protein